jgi:hypothetical protein
MRLAFLQKPPRRHAVRHFCDWAESSEPAGAISQFLPLIGKFRWNLTADAERGGLICFRLGTAVLVGHPIFLEQFLHLFRDHVPIVRNGDEGNLLPRFGGRLTGGILSLRPGCIRIRHRYSIHESGMDYILLEGL